ncbi:hypothetical protein VHEMI09860 [[Torrubiella] hemipterigena]|uniref:Uncharacterized protein n=1 Tax=[Torrubiella] hemipterigena TaxID=1531966 RepID=A0A0A1TB98_9HYPO|nr:hypothetical protein VHEMI09860 [[Torrubiella] hemipterigena]
MPTVTVVNDLVFGNLGPLTTTFTAPTTCAIIAAQPVIYQAKNTKYSFDPRDMDAIKVYPDQMRVASVRCGEDPRDQCLPSAEGWQKSHTYGQTLAYNYYSPGVHCPVGYTTAGVKAASSASGIFTQTRTFAEASGVGLNWFAREFLSPEETMVICVPSGYTAHPFIPGVASSTMSIPVESYTTVCSAPRVTPNVATVTRDGTTKIEVHPKETGAPNYDTRYISAALNPSTYMTEFGSEPDQFSGDAQVFDERPLIILVHTKEDMERHGDQGSQNDTKGDDAGGAGSTARPSAWAYAGIPIMAAAALGAITGWQM